VEEHGQLPGGEGTSKKSETKTVSRARTLRRECVSAKTANRTREAGDSVLVKTEGDPGACLCAATNQSLIIAAILGGVGGVIGAFAGYEIRRKLVAGLNIKDIFIALLEDLITIGLACFFVSR
jgi:uncharacterized membrane protein